MKQIALALSLVVLAGTTAAQAYPVDDIYTSICTGSKCSMQNVEERPVTISLAKPKSQGWFKRLNPMHWFKGQEEAAMNMEASVEESETSEAPIPREQ